MFLSVLSLRPSKQIPRTIVESYEGFNSLRFLFLSRRILLGSITFDESLAVTTPKSSSTALAIAAAERSEIPYRSQALANAGSLRRDTESSDLFSTIFRLQSILLCAAGVSDPV